MLNLKIQAVVAAVMILVCGCAAKFNEDSLNTVKKRATFDMSCDVQKLKIQCLDSFKDIGGDHCSQYGVTGCEKKSVYVYAQGVWVLNSDIEKTE
jgi:hypothetical protein